MSIPVFSIIVTSYNREQYIQETLESILSQSYQDYELIVCDDCSSDSTFEIALSYQSKFSNVQFHRNTENLGQFPNRNRATKLAKGNYILFVDSDDTIKEGTLEYLSRIVNTYSDVDFFIISKMPSSNGCMQLNSNEAYRFHFYEKSILHIGPGGTLISRKLFERIGGFPVCYGVAGDMYYNLIAAAYSDVLLLDFDYLNYRRHAGQEINKAYEYLIYGYLYFKDVLSRHDSPLLERERTKLIDKSKRRFLLNAITYAFKKRSYNVLITAFRAVDYRFSDFLKALIA
jgi:glycosyltransferase involved in cell wall biosynthesis